MTIRAIKSPVLFAWASTLAACNNHQATPIDNATVNATQTTAASPYQPTATLQEVMDSIVDPSSDYIWKAVGTISDEHGVHDYRPHTEKEWHELRQRAIVLAEAANLIAVPGRRVAGGERTVEDNQPLPVAEIQQRIDTNRAPLIGFAAALRDVSVKLVVAADSKDVAAISDLGGTLDEVCEGCHKVFWYPDQLKQ